MTDKNKDLNKDMNRDKNVGSTGQSGNLDQEKMGHDTTRKPSTGGFSGSTGNISGSRPDVGESDIEKEGDVERGSTKTGNLNRDVERGGRS